MFYSGGHTPNLSVQSFAQRHLQPGSRHIFAEADRHGTIRQLWNVAQQPNFSRSGFLAVQRNTVPQLPQGLLARDTFNLREIHFRQLMQRVCDMMRQRTVRRQQQQPFTIQIEATSCIDPRQIDIVRQCRPSLWVGKAGQHPVGLVERNRAKYRHENTVLSFNSVNPQSQSRQHAATISNPLQ